MESEYTKNLLVPAACKCVCKCVFKLFVYIYLVVRWLRLSSYILMRANLIKLLLSSNVTYININIYGNGLWNFFTFLFMSNIKNFEN